MRSVRVGKFRDVIEFLTAAGCTLPDRTLEALLARYAAVLEPPVAAAPAAPGAAEFLRSWPGPVAVATSAPLAEAAGHLASLRFRPMDHISAYPTPKRTPSGNWPGRPWHDRFLRGRAQRPGGRPGRLGPFRRDWRQRPALAPGDA
jgi:hypothetical protein